MNTEVVPYEKQVGALTVSDVRGQVNLIQHVLREVMQEAESRGFATLKAQQQELGTKVRALLASKGFKSVAAPGFEAPGVVVCYTDDPDLQNGKKFMAAGLQTAAGVPLQCDEGADFRTFRIGLFGLDKWANVARTVKSIEDALEKIARG